MNVFPPSVLIIAEPREIAESGQVWGSGGWLPPEERRGLDWFTLCRLSGLQPLATSRETFDPASVDDGIHWLILACDPVAIDPDLIRRLKVVLERQSITIICQAPWGPSPLARWLGIQVGDETVHGSRLTAPVWPDACDWRCRNPVEIPRLHTDDHASVVASLDAFPLIVSSPQGMGRVIVTGFDAGVMRDAEGVFTRLLQRLLVFSSPVPLPWIDWSATLVLRMDDPGSCEALYNGAYHNTKLHVEEWEALGDELAKRNARLSACYVPGWVDAGESIKGKLEVDGREVERVPGKVYPSPTVRFEFHGDDGILTYDHVGEFQAIRTLMAARLVGVELHGYTHLSPDRQSWLKARDRFDSNSWFREFGRDAVSYLEEHPEIPHPLQEALRIFETFFHRRPTSLICPGEEFTRHVLVKALAEGLPLVSSYYLAIRDGCRFCWSQHVCAPYLDIAGDIWFDAALPVVGYFHDFDIAKKGVEWFSACLDQWQQAGARRIIDLGELAAILGTSIAMRKRDSEWELEVRGDSSLPLPRAFEWKIYFPDGNVPSAISCTIGGRRQILPLTHAGACGASVLIGG